MGVILGGAPVVPGANTAGNETVRGYRPELDAVRFVAFLLVFFNHFLRFYPPYVASGHHPILAGQTVWNILLILDQICTMGLCLFFTLSAYLITDLLLHEREQNTTISVRRFYIRRALRIWPLYFLGIAIGIGIALVAHRKNDVTGFVWYLLFVGNFYCAAFGWPQNPMEPLWSISIEEQFYLLWPWAMRWLSRHGLLACAILFIVMANITLMILGRHGPSSERESWFNTFVQFEMFAAGILLALAKKRIAWRKPAFGLTLALAGPLVWVAACSIFRARQLVAEGTVASATFLAIGYGLTAVGCAAILHGFCMIGPAYVPQWAATLGKISFGLYVYHHLAIGFTQALFISKHGLFYFALSGFLALVLTVAFSIISYTYLETPFLRLKRRFEILHSKPI